MKFLYVDIFYLAIIPFILFIILLLKKDKLIYSVFSKEVLDKLIVNNGAISKTTRNILFCSSLFFMIIALSRPVIENEDEKLKKEGGSIVIGIDVSKSMLAKDIYPNRLEAGKKKAIEFANLNQNNQIGLISFSNHSFMLSPLSLDMEAISFLIHYLDTSSISTAGTNILSALQSANELLKDNTQKSLIIISDGGDSDDFTQDIEFANENNIIVSVINIGTLQGSPIPSKKGFIQDKNNNIVIVKRNDSIKELALQTGGVFATWSYDNKDISSILNHLEDILIKKKFDEKIIKNYKELFIYPLVLALTLLLLAFISLPRKIMILLLVSFLYNPQNLNAGILDFVDIKKANEAYHAKDYNKSSKYYKKIAKEKKSNESYYNLANSYYKNKEFKKALQNYKKIQNTKDIDKASMLHNMGNAYFNTKKLEEAKKSYEDSLALKDNEDTKFNLELAKKILKEQKKKKKKGEKDKKDDKGDKSKKDEGDKKDKQKKKKETKDGEKENKDAQKENKEKENKEKRKNQDEQENQDEKKKKDNKVDYDNKEDIDKSGKQAPMKKRKFIGKQEERKWLEKIKKQKTQVSPTYKFNFKGKQNDKDW